MGKKVETIYGESVKPDKALKAYSQHFEIVEINNTFYKLPTKTVIKNWYNQTPSNFKFICKFSRFATHAKKMINFSEYFEEFWDDNVEHLQEKCLGLLIQLGPSFVNSNKKSKVDEKTPFERLEAAAEYLKVRDLPLKYFIEFRDPSWFSGETFDKISKLGFYPVCVNLNNIGKNFSKMASGFSPNLSYFYNSPSDYVYIRCHGTWARGYHGGYKQEDLMKMVSISSVTKNLIIMFDNTDTLEGEIEINIENKIAFDPKIVNSKCIGSLVYLLPHCVLNAKQVQELDKEEYTEKLWIDS